MDTKALILQYIVKSKMAATAAILELYLELLLLNVKANRLEIR